MDLMSCIDCRKWYLENREPLGKAATEISDNRYSRRQLIELYIKGYHDSGHDEDYAQKED